VALVKGSVFILAGPDRTLVAQVYTSKVDELWTGAV
jgi:hypothetical protein